ncbi:hypothetical protein CDL15_Pgr019616 [Punica granatum]|uniref:Arginine decarboxylase n=1 Tax=Punica granatum TaxID=22663 RepID=A0A218X6L9_PUNGR|nr:hypothetical protein CDL15_Pgr019616 [Punica granatum]
MGVTTWVGGAYEQAQGGLHNLLGGPNVVWVDSQPGTPCRFTMTLARPDPTCGDLLQTMPHEPRYMVEAFRRCAEELGVDRDDQDGLVTEALAGRLARFFYIWPYLVATLSWGMRAVSGNSFYR